MCEQCQKKLATVHLTKIINNQKEVICLCEDCAGNYHSFSIFDGNYSIHNLLTSLIQQSKGAHLINYRNHQVCECCQIDYSKFGQSGKLGCSKCYGEFADNIKPLLRKIHGNHQHDGKLPKRTGQEYRIKRDVEKLRQELRQLVEEEKFEQAALVRDKIKDIEGNLE